MGFRCGGTFDDSFIANFSQCVTVKFFWITMYIGNVCLHRHYFDMSPQIWSSQDVNAFHSRFDLHKYLRDNGISCLFAIDAVLTSRLLKGIS